MDLERMQAREKGAGEGEEGAVLLEVEAEIEAFGYGRLPSTAWIPKTDQIGGRHDVS
jgi:hypothetical protein